MKKAWIIWTLLFLCQYFVTSQQQQGLANLLQTILTNNVDTLGVPQAAQQQPGLAVILANLLGDNGTATTLSQNFQQQQGLTNLLTTLLSNNDVALALLQIPELASDFAGLLNYLNTTGNVTGVVTALFTDQPISSLTTSPVTLLFENYSLTVLTNNRVSDACQTDMIIYIEELLRGTQWALKMIDATGKPGSDLADGLTKFIGSYEECVSIQAVSYTQNVDGNTRMRGSFDGKYCSAFFNVPGFPSDLQTFGAGYTQLGVCVPDTCSPSDVQIIVSIVERAILNRTVPYLPTVRCQDTERDIGLDVIISIGILSIIGCLIVVGTLYDIFVVQKAKSKTISNSNGACQQPNTLVAKKTGILDSEKKVNVTPVENSIAVKVQSDWEDDTTIKYHEQQTGNVVWLLIAFSIYSNGIKTLSTKRVGSQYITAIDGIRVLTIGWVMLSHTYYYGGRYDANLLQFEVGKMSNWTSMLPAYADVAVDTFFALSGILVAYLSLKKLKKVDGPWNFNWLMFYVQRFLRITPTYMLILMIGTVLLPRLFYGPLWNSEALKDMAGCRETWWANLLYIHNYLYARQPAKMCMGWSWYLSADMHMYLVSPFLVVPLYVNVIFGMVFCLAVLISITIATGLLTYNRNYPVQPLLLPYTNEVNLIGFYPDIYNPSHMRFAPYVVGILTGYLLYRVNCRMKISKNINLFGWFVSISLSLVIVYVRYSYEDDRIFSGLDSAIFMALHRVLWSTVPCWVVFSCATGYGGWINALLSWRAFVPLGRLTFCVYLIHPIVMTVFYASRMVTTYFTIFEVVYLFLAHVTLSFVVAFILHLAFELPVIGLEKTLLGRFAK